VTGNDTTGEEDTSVSDPTDVKFVGPATATVVAEAPFDAAAISERAVSYAMLTEAGVNPGVAARLRREHSLAWSFEGGDSDDLADRSDQIRGLRDEEREWVAASSGDWENAEVSTSDDEDEEEEWVAASTGDWGDAGAATTDGSGDAQQAEAAWRERSKPDPVTDVPGVDDAAAVELAEAGITSVRSLAVADPERVADSLTLDRGTVTEWRDAARKLQ
jgi:predicted flap endonuclease-1-like 5' DNA nuclease